jgi:hypothetical protein
MSRSLRAFLLVSIGGLLVASAGCDAFAPRCGTPNVATVDGHVVDGAGKPISFAGKLCVSVDYCEDTFSGCDPPNEASDCVDVTTDAHGAFTATLEVSSPDSKDLIARESFSLGKAHVALQTPHGDECDAPSLTFTNP